MMDLERKFTSAVAVIQGLPKNGSFQPSNEMKLQFYAYYKQATQGPCKAERPGFWEIIARAKHDAWAALGDMERNTAMVKYIDNLKQIIETMKFSADVGEFLEVLGPFYEYVDEDKIIANNASIQARAKLSQKEFRDMHHNDNNMETLIEETDDIDDMIGRYNISDSDLDDEDSDFMKEDFIRDDSIDLAYDDNIDNHEKLIEEIRLTKERLEYTKTMLENTKKETDNPPNIEKIADTFEGRPLNKQEIDKMLGNVDGYLPKKNNEAKDIIENIEVVLEKSFYSATASRSPQVQACDDDSDQDEIFEDTVESPDNMCASSSDNIKVEVEKDASTNFNVEVTIVDTVNQSAAENSLFNTNSPFVDHHDSGIYESSNESLSNHLPAVSKYDQTNQIHFAPHHTRHAPTGLSQDTEPDEILIVSSHSVQDTPTEHSLDQLSYQLHLTVDQVQRDLEHLHARVNSLETILTLQGEPKSTHHTEPSSWWPLDNLPPKTILFLVTWPLLTHGVIAIVKAALKKSRK